MHLHELLGWSGPVTHRQYAAWHEWLKADLNRPSRSDHYVMQATREFILPHLKEGVRPPGIGDYKIRFSVKGESEPAASTPDEETDGPPVVTQAMIDKFHRDMAVAKLGVGKNVVKRWVDKHGNPVPPPPSSTP